MQFDESHARDCAAKKDRTHIAESRRKNICSRTALSCLCKTPCNGLKYSLISRSCLVGFSWSSLDNFRHFYILMSHVQTPKRLRHSDTWVTLFGVNVYPALDRKQCVVQTSDNFMALFCATTHSPNLQRVALISTTISHSTEHDDSVKWNPRFYVNAVLVLHTLSNCTEFATWHARRNVSCILWFYFYFFKRAHSKRL